MTAALTPALALAYLRELSTDLRRAVVLDAAGAPLAGDAELAARARALLAAAADGAAREIAREGEELLVAVRAPDGSALAVAAGPHALLPLLLHDVEHVLAGLDLGKNPANSG